PLLQRVRGPGRALRAQAECLDHAHRRLGQGPGEAGPDPDAERVQRQHRRVLAARRAAAGGSAHRARVSDQRPERRPAPRRPRPHDGHADRRWRRVVLDFEGGALRQLGAGADVKPVVWTASEGELVQQNAFKNPVTGGWRLAFQLKQQKGKAVELRASLQHKGETITETWSYLLLP